MLVSSSRRGFQASRPHCARSSHPSHSRNGVASPRASCSDAAEASPAMYAWSCARTQPALPSHRQVPPSPSLETARHAASSFWARASSMAVNCEAACNCWSATCRLAELNPLSSPPPPPPPPALPPTELPPLAPLPPPLPQWPLPPSPCSSADVLAAPGACPARRVRVAWARGARCEADVSSAAAAHQPREAAGRKRCACPGQHTSTMGGR